MAEHALPARYEPKHVETRLYAAWLQAKAFDAPTDSPKEPFTMVMPPPNVTGSLHLGHALDNTLPDILIRFKRMQGYNACWIPGTDHAGIGTQVVVEKELKKEGLSRHDLGREKFLERVWKWKEQSGNQILEQLKLMGCSCDWSRLRFTMDEGFSRAVREHFVRLYEEGLIYRAERMANWCPRCQTALSDLEVKHRDLKGSLWHIRYPLQGGGELVLATTRPETLLGDTAVAVHPDDERYRHLTGKIALLPLLDRPIPIIADTYVDRSFGTGVVKITPAHDPNDFAVGQRHQLVVINILNPDATLNAEAGPYAGLDRFKARDRVVADLEAKGLLVSTEPHTSAVGHCDRCDTILEPMVSKQWYMRMAPLAAEAIKAVESGAIKLVPDNAPAVFFEWMRNIRDWCISRQIWWGHRIPIWYCQRCGNLIVARQDPTACPQCQGELKQDPDTLDTWFSSALWPFSTLGWPEETADLKRFYPTSVLVTGWDILFLWVTRMIMVGIKLTGQAPFHTVVLHSLITDPEGKKMSKSKGNVVDPLELFARYGTDAVRFTLSSLETMRQSFRLSTDKVEHSRNFMNKIWNAARFSLAELEGFTPSPEPPTNRSVADRWIFSRAQERTTAATKALERYQFNEYAGILTDFFWYEFCDIYLELTKPALRRPAERAAVQWTLWAVLDTTMKLMHPVIPFITEEIWQRLPRLAGAGPLLMQEPWPVPNPEREDAQAEALLATAQSLTQHTRALRHEQGFATGQPVTLAVLPANADAHQQLERLLSLGYIAVLTKTNVIALSDGAQPPLPNVSMVIPGYTLFLQLSGAANPESERKRLLKEQDELQALLNKTSATLANEDYLAKAPPRLVADSRKKAEDYEARLTRLAERLRQLALLH